MSTDEDTEVADDGAAAPGTRPTDTPEPSWWHRDHPIFTPLTGFFTGLLVIVVIPSIFGTVLAAVLPDDVAASVFPFVLVVFAVPLVLLAFRPTRRFGRYLLLGMAVTTVVVVVVAALTLWFLVSRDT